MSATEVNPLSGEVASTGDTGQRAGHPERVQRHVEAGTTWDLYRVPLAEGTEHFGLEVTTRNSEWTSWREFATEADAREAANRWISDARHRARHGR